MDNFSWVCPICNRPVTITETQVSDGENVLAIDNPTGPKMVVTRFIVCPNAECQGITLEARMSEASYGSLTGWQEGEKLKEWQLVPQSKAQSFPQYIPKVILDDYGEACLIKDLSPKASATISRRCLQGIIRDYWKVNPGKLNNEIQQIKGRVELLTWQAIDAVRGVGNIGAHMEEDVDLIVDIEPNEAELLIELIETLFKDWYIARQEKNSRLEAIVKLGEVKKIARKKKVEE